METSVSPCRSPLVDPNAAVPQLVDGSPLTPLQQKQFSQMVRLIIDGSEDLEEFSKERRALLYGEIAPEYSSAACLRRYLVATNWNVRKAALGLLQTVRWRGETFVTPPVLSELDNCLRSRYAEWYGHDPQGRPVLYLRSKNADLSISRDHRVRYMIFTLERGILMMRHAHHGRGRDEEQWIIILDETGKESKHSDLGFITHATPIVFNHYVERLYRVYIVNPGWLTSMAVSCAKLLIDERTSSKFESCYTNDEGVCQPLVDAVGRENLHAQYGGSAPGMELQEYRSLLESLSPSAT